ncbi:MAG TPA: c-type cytochrome biogenesis protein CcmI, partial [Burkholderiaceae bacterium]|nr:c-type cytochrome biogenesis protein CcmI [Burkholderiaceae bacterium]
MTAFIAIATVMVAIALAWLLWPLLRAARRPVVERHVANASIYGDQFADLDADLRRGTISEASYAEARGELERRLLDEGRAQGGNSTAPVSSNRATAIVVALAVPLVAGLMYWKLGAPDAFSPMATAPTAPDASHQMTPEQLDGMVQQLAARLEKEPGNVEGWVILARTYYAMRKFPEAAAAYEKLTQLVPDEPDLLADYADALAMSQGRDLSGRPFALVQAALKINPTHWKALAMAGTAAFDRKDYKGAVDYWERLRSSQPADSPIAQSIAVSISEARKLGGLPPAPAIAAAPQKASPATMPSPAAAAPASEASKGTTAAQGTTVGGIVNLSDAIKAKAAPTDTVFIFARPAEGSRMPLALTQVKVSELPARFTLDDTMAMSQDMKLSTTPSVIVGARVSKSGRPMPSSGDLEGLSKPVAIGTKDVAVTIDRVL